jgi:hypothetical protein
VAVGVVAEGALAEVATGAPVDGAWLVAGAGAVTGDPAAIGPGVAEFGARLTEAKVSCQVRARGAEVALVGMVVLTPAVVLEPVEALRYCHSWITYTSPIPGRAGTRVVKIAASLLSCLYETRV